MLGNHEEIEAGDSREAQSGSGISIQERQEGTFFKKFLKLPGGQRLITEIVTAAALLLGNAATASAKTKPIAVAKNDKNEKATEENRKTYEENRRTYREATDLYEAGKYMGAMAVFEELLKRTKEPDLIFNIAQCYANMAKEEKDPFKYQMAIDKFNKYISEIGSSDPRAARARGEIAEIEAALQRIEQKSPAQAAPPAAVVPAGASPASRPTTPRTPGKVGYGINLSGGPLWSLGEGRLGGSLGLEAAIRVRLHDRVFLVIGGEVIEEFDPIVAAESLDGPRSTGLASRTAISGVLGGDFVLREGDRASLVGEFRAGAGWHMTQPVEVAGPDGYRKIEGENGVALGGRAGLAARIRLLRGAHLHLGGGATVRAREERTLDGKTGGVTERFTGRAGPYGTIAISGSF